MADVTNLASAVNAKTLLLAETLATITGGLLPANDDVPIGILRRKTTIIANAAVRTLPTAGVQILPAPPAGNRFKLLGLTVTVYSSSGAYTGMNTTYADLHLELSGGAVYTQYPILVNDSTTTPAITQLTRTFNGHDILVDVVPIPACTVTPAGSDGYVLANASTDGGAGPSAWAGQPIDLKMDNNGSGNLGGGHANNYIKVVAYYVQEPLT